MPDIDVKIFRDLDGSLWDHCRNYIRSNCQTDPLYDNYKDLDPTQYLYFNCAVLDGQIVSFGAIEASTKKWSSSIARVLTRFWIHPDFRSTGLTKWNDDKIRFSPMILKSQLEFLKNHHEIEIAMITREGRYQNSFKEIVRLANTVSEKEFVIMPGKYNVCEPMDRVPESCKQMIALSSLKGTSTEKTFDEITLTGRFRQTL